MNLPPLLPLPVLVAPPALPVLPLPIPPLPVLSPWRKSPEVNPAAPGWYLTRWRAEFPEARMYWDGVWWCVEIDNTMHRLAHVNIRNWSCEWKPL